YCGASARCRRCSWRRRNWRAWACASSAPSSTAPTPTRRLTDWRVNSGPPGEYLLLSTERRRCRMRLLPVAVAGAVLAASGAGHGRRPDRGGASARLAAAAGRLADVPTSAGDWSATELEIDPRQLAIAEAVGHLSQRYAAAGRRSVELLILCGRAG